MLQRSWYFWIRARAFQELSLQDYYSAMFRSTLLPLSWWLRHKREVLRELTGPSGKSASILIAPSDLDDIDDIMVVL